MSEGLCPRCKHPAWTHWPNNDERPTTACVFCLDAQIVSGPVEWRGFCCVPRRDIPRADQ